MIRVNVNDNKKLKFNIEVRGVQPQDIIGSMKIFKEGVEYGFPIEMKEGSVRVNIKPLSKVIAEELEDGDKLNARLEVVAGDTFMVPWTDTVEVVNPRKVEVKLEHIQEEEVIEETIVPTISVRGILEEEVDEQLGSLNPKARKNLEKEVADKKTNRKKKKEKEDVKKKKPKSRFGKMLSGE